jgi:HlyD family secretion protein
VKSPKKRWISAIVVVAAVAAGVFIFLKWRGGGNGAPTYQTVAASRGRLAAQVTATGTLSPVVTVQVGSQVSGRIQALNADFNSKVTKGQVIAKIDPQLIESEVARAKANLTAANASVTRARAELADARQKMERANALAAKKLVAQAEADSAKATHDAAVAGVSSAQASLSQARAGLKQAETNLAYTTIVSPIDGVVISRDVDVGQTVAASLQAPTLFTIAEDLAKMEVHTSVAESDVGSLANDMPVEFTVDAFANERFRGKVKQVRYSPQTVQNVVTYDAVVEVDNPDLKLRPGMTANVTFLVEERTNALAVPNTALRFRPSPEVLAELGISEETMGGGRPGRDGEPRAERPGGPRAAAGETATAARPADGAERPQGGRREEVASPPGGAGRAEGRERSGRDRNRRMVWRLGPGGEPEPVRVQIGISDGRQTEIVDGELREGDLIITGLAGDTAAEPPPGQQNRGGRRGNRSFL